MGEIPLVLQKSYGIIVYILLLFFPISCKHSYTIHLENQGVSCTIDGVPVKHGETYFTKKKNVFVCASGEGYHTYRASIENTNFFSTQQVRIILEKKQFPVKIDTIDVSSDIYIDGKSLGPSPVKPMLTYGPHTLVLKRGGYESQEIRLFITREDSFLLRHQKKAFPGDEDIAINPVGIFNCASQPKQVVFSPDSRFICIPLLNSVGFQVFDRELKKIARFVSPRSYGKKIGFVEGIFIPEKKTFLVSQMTTGRIFEYSYAPDSENVVSIIRSFPTGGIWSKVIAWSPEKELCAVSNWTSNDVSLIEYGSGTITGRIRGLYTPRGIVFSPKGDFLYVTSYNSGRIYKVAVKTRKSAGILYKRGAAMRHIVLSRDGSLCYVSNMRHNEVYEINTGAFTIQKTYPVPENPNTIDLSPCGRYLFVSTRGPNNPRGYLYRSPGPGKIAVIDLTRQKMLFEIEGGTQPTGLDVSPCGSYLAFSNFQDNTIELYEIIYNKNRALR